MLLVQGQGGLTSRLYRQADYIHSKYELAESDGRKPYCDCDVFHHHCVYPVEDPRELI